MKFYQVAITDPKHPSPNAITYGLYASETEPKIGDTIRIEEEDPYGNIEFVEGVLLDIDREGKRMSPIKVTKATEILFKKYPNQMKPQETFFELDTETGSLDARYNPEIGNAVPIDVGNGIRLRFAFPPYASVKWINSTLEDPKFLDLMQRIVNESEIVWNGSKRRGVLTETGQKLVSDVEVYIDMEYSPEHDGIVVIDADGNWVCESIKDMIDNKRLTKESTDEEIDKMVEEIKSDIEGNLAPKEVYWDFDIQEALLSEKINLIRADEDYLESDHSEGPH